MRRVLTLLSATLLCVLDCRPAAAATCTTSSGGVAFGTYTVTNASALNGSGTINVTCSTLVSLGLSYTIALDAGVNGTFAARRMKNGTSFLSYNLYTTAARSVIWGDGTASTATVSDSITLLIGTTSNNYTVFGQIPAMQDKAAGTFNDTITVTITY